MSKQWNIFIDYMFEKAVGSGNARESRFNKYRKEAQESILNYERRMANASTCPIAPCERDNFHTLNLTSYGTNPTIAPRSYINYDHLLLLEEERLENARLALEQAKPYRTHDINVCKPIPWKKPTRSYESQSKTTFQPTENPISSKIPTVVVQGVDDKDTARQGTPHHPKSRPVTNDGHSNKCDLSWMGPKGDPIPPQTNEDLHRARSEMWTKYAKQLVIEAEQERETAREKARLVKKLEQDRQIKLAKIASSLIVLKDGRDGRTRSTQAAFTLGSSTPSTEEATPGLLSPAEVTLPSTSLQSPEDLNDSVQPCCNVKPIDLADLTNISSMMLQEYNGLRELDRRLRELNTGDDTVSNEHLEQEQSPDSFSPDKENQANESSTFIAKTMRDIGKSDSQAELEGFAKLPVTPPASGKSAISLHMKLPALAQFEEAAKAKLGSVRVSHDDYNEEKRQRQRSFAHLVQLQKDDDCENAIASDSESDEESSESEEESCESEERSSCGSEEGLCESEEESSESEKESSDSFSHVGSSKPLTPKLKPEPNLGPDLSIGTKTSVLKIDQHEEEVHRRTLGADLEAAAKVVAAQRLAQAKAEAQTRQAADVQLNGCNAGDWREMMKTAAEQQDGKKSVRFEDVTPYHNDGTDEMLEKLQRRYFQSHKDMVQDMTMEEYKKRLGERATEVSWPKPMVDKDPRRGTYGVMETHYVRNRHKRWKWNFVVPGAEPPHDWGA